MRVSLAHVMILAASGVAASLLAGMSRSNDKTLATIPSGPPSGVAMIPSFDEEFAGDHVDAKRWNLSTAGHGGGSSIKGRSLWGNGELEIYFDQKFLGLGINPLSVANGALTISAKPLDANAKRAVFSEMAKTPNLIQPGAALPNIGYSSGAITTSGLFQQKYGYFEMRAAWSGGKGVWPAFWLLPANGSWPPEIDIVEAHGDKPGLAFQSLHTRSAPSVTKKAENVGDQSAFHRYGILWLPDRIDYYVDGVKTNSIPSSPDVNQPMFMTINLAIGGYWPGYPDPSPSFSASYKIDYVRVWRFRDAPPASAP